MAGPDGHHAAFAITGGYTLITPARAFARFDGLSILFPE
jgi:predicted nucleic acid-binding protein